MAEDEDVLILDSVGRFLDREVKPYVHALEHDDIYPREIVERMKELGLFGATISADYGGLGLTTGTYAKIVEKVSTVWMSLAGVFRDHSVIGDSASQHTSSISSMRIGGSGSGPRNASSPDFSHRSGNWSV